MPFKQSLKLLNLGFAVGILLLSSFFIIKLNDSLKGIEVLAILEDELESEKIEEVKKALQGLKEVASIHFSHPDETVKVWAKTFNRMKLLECLEENPFPPLFRIKLKKSGSLSRLNHLTESLKKISGIKAVDYGGQRIEEAIRRTKLYLLGFLLVFFGALINLLDHIFINR